jgi:hypothetical protein
VRHSHRHERRSLDAPRELDEVPRQAPEPDRTPARRSPLRSDSPISSRSTRLPRAIAPACGAAAPT